MTTEELSGRTCWKIYYDWMQWEDVCGSCSEGSHWCYDVAEGGDDDASH